MKTYPVSKALLYALQDHKLNPYSLFLCIIFVQNKKTWAYISMFTLMHLLLFAPNVADFINLFLFHNFPSSRSHLNNVLRRFFLVKKYTSKSLRTFSLSASFENVIKNISGAAIH